MRVPSRAAARSLLQALLPSALIAATGACMAACSAPPPTTAGATLHRFREMIMGVEVRIVIDDDSAELATRSARAAFDAVRNVDESISDWTASSALAATLRAAEAAPAGTPVPANAILVDAARRAAEMSRLTDGAFDCTAAPLVAVWREARRAGAPPADDAIAQAMKRVGSRHLHADPSQGTLRFDIREMSLDFGGIGKGIASAAAVAAARRDGCDRVLVAVSGDVAAGAAPRGREGWQVAIESGLGSLEPCVVWLRESALSTSGDAEQVLVHGGTRHSHIVDPRTGKAVTDAIAPTVWSPDAAVADAAATALSVLGVRAMDSLCARIRATGVPIEMRVAYRDAPGGPVQVRSTPGFPPCISAAAMEPGRAPRVPQDSAATGIR
jgi:thiamine biosynthesis lipoprotein